MIEIVCPSCQARYQLPDGSIGPDGRKVSCSSCSHKWHAQVESPAAMAEATGVAAAEHRSTESRPIAAVAGAGAFAGGTAGDADDESEDDFSNPPPATGDRDQQMQAIRQMLADLKETADTAEPEPEPEQDHSPDAPTPTMRKRDEDEDRDTLKSRIDELTKSSKAAKGEAAQSGYDAARLRRLHEKRAKKLQRSRERRGKSGGFLTGFTLVAVVTATMVGLYVLKPQIIAASLEPALNEYTVTVDRYRVELNESTAEWQTWLKERIAKLRGEEQQGGTQTQ